MKLPISLPIKLISRGHEQRSQDDINHVYNGPPGQKKQDQSQDGDKSNILLLETKRQKQHQELSQLSSFCSSHYTNSKNQRLCFNIFGDRKTTFSVFYKRSKFLRICQVLQLKSKFQKKPCSYGYITTQEYIIN